MYKSSFGASNEQVAAAKLRWQEVYNMINEKDEENNQSKTKKYGEVKTEILKDSFEQDNNENNKKGKEKFSLITSNKIYQPQKKQLYKITEKSSLKDVLGDEMYHYCLNNPKKAFAFSRLFRYSLAEFNKDNGIEDEFGSNLLEAAEIIGEEIVISYLNNPPVFFKIVHAFLPLISDIEKKEKEQKKIMDMYSIIPYSNYYARINWLCKLVVGNESNLLDSLNAQNVKFVKDICRINPKDLSIKESHEFTELINYLRLDLIFYVKTSIADIIDRKERTKEVILNRVAGKTLEDIGQNIGVTRERIRQIEKKVQDSFDTNNSFKKYLFILAAFAIKDGIVYAKHIKELFNELADVFIYLLKNSNVNYYIYSQELDAFLIADYSWYHNLERYIDDLPDMLQEKELIEIIKSIVTDLGIECYFDEVDFLVRKSYMISGQYYSRTRKSLSSIYKIVIAQCYPNGIRLYDKAEFNRFRKNIISLFGDIKLPDNNRAIDARILDIGVLCDRGTYTLPQFINIEESLVKEISNYIKNSSRNTFSFLELFEQFRIKLLQSSNVNNRYFLQGVLKLYCKNEFYFTRDTVSKDKNQTSFINELEKFVELSGTVTKDQIKAEFSGVTEAMLLFSIMKSRNIIVSDFCEYMHPSLLDIVNEDYKVLGKLIGENIKDMPISSRKLLELLYSAYPEFLNRNKIASHSKLFGVLQYMFWDVYKFSRPFIGEYDSEDISTINIVKGYLDGCDEFAISDLVEYCKDNHLRYLSNASLIRQLGHEYIRADRNLCVNINQLNVDDNKIALINSLVLDSTRQKGYLVLKNIIDFMFFPDVGIKWTGFLLESIIYSFFDDYNIVYIPTSDGYLLNGIIVNSDLKIENYEELIKYAIKNEHNCVPFKDISEIKDWLYEEGLINNLVPKAILGNKIITVDEYGKVIIE
jgi:hypothetical protein